MLGDVVECDLSIHPAVHGYLALFGAGGMWRHWWRRVVPHLSYIVIGTSRLSSPLPPPSNRTCLYLYILCVVLSYRYWQCFSIGGRVLLIPRNCPLGTAVNDFYSLGASAPCSKSFSPHVKFDCTRKKFRADELPECLIEYKESGEWFTFLHFAFLPVDQVNPHCTSWLSCD